MKEDTNMSRIYPIIMTQLKFTHQDNLTYPYNDRGMQFGDGIYEVIRVYEGHCYLLDEHIDRLFRSAEAIKINLPFTKDEIKNNLTDLLKRNHMSRDGKIYLQITRGAAQRSHAFPENITPNIYAYVKNLPRNEDYLKNGISTITARDERWENCYIKSLNLLPNVLAKQEAREKGCYEAILHRDGTVTEGSSSNIFLVKEGKIYTHPATKRILHGCVRAAVIRLASALNIEVIEKAFEVEDIPYADEMFLTSSTSEVLPIIKVDNTTIGDGKPGAITRKLQEAYEQDAQIKQRVFQ